MRWRCVQTRFISYFSPACSAFNCSPHSRIHSFTSPTHLAFTTYLYLSTIFEPSPNNIINFASQWIKQRRTRKQSRQPVQSAQACVAGVRKTALATRAQKAVVPPPHEVLPRQWVVTGRDFLSYHRGLLSTIQLENAHKLFEHSVASHNWFRTRPTRNQMVLGSMCTVCIHHRLPDQPNAAWIRLWLKGTWTTRTTGYSGTMLRISEYCTVDHH